MRRAAFMFAGALFVGGLVAAHEPTPVPEISGADQLVKEKGRFRETWVRPDVDITQYSKLLVWQPAFEFREVGEAGGRETTSKLLTTGGGFAIREEDRQKFAEIVSDAFVRELERSKMFQVVDEVGPDTLIVRSGVLDIVSDVPPPYTGTSDIYLSSVGQATIVFQLIDAETGVIQATAGERREIQPRGRGHMVSTIPISENTVWIEVERWARQAAQDLRRELEKARKKAQ